MVPAVGDPIVAFDDPPVVEVVAGVAFDGLTPDVGPLLAAFWKERLRERFPIVQQQPAYSPPQEQFPADGPTINFNLQLSTTFPTARLWALSRDGQQVVQLQPGWFARNWKRVGKGEEYEYWEQRREAFRNDLAEFIAYLTDEGIGDLKLRQCEITYINHISPSETWSNHSEFANVFNVSLQKAMPYGVEQMSLQAQSILEYEGNPCGRLYVKILPAFGTDGRSPLYVFELTARGAPQGEGIDGAFAFLDLGRVAANRTFLSLTTQAMQREWGTAL
jgi:uncharacterized protein (TIGR04255 family)